MTDVNPFVYLRRRRRRNRLGDSDWDDIAYRVEIVLLPPAALGYLAWYALTRTEISPVSPPPWLGWLLSSVLALYGILRVLAAVGLGPVRLDPAEAELVAAAPLPVRWFIVGRLRNAVLKETLGVILVSVVWSVQAYGSFGASFSLVFPLTLAGLLPYVATVVACGWLVENAPELQRVVKNLLPRLAWVLVPVVFLSPLVVELAVGSDERGAARWWGPWAWAADPGLQALHGRVDLTGMYLGLGLCLVAWVFALRAAGRPAGDEIARRSRLYEMRKALRAFQDAAGLHNVRRQLWSPERVHVGGRLRLLPSTPPPGMRALVWKSARHILREGTGSWAMPVAAYLATAAVAAYAQPLVAIGVGLVLVYIPASRVLTPMLADLEVDAIAAQLPFGPRVRVATALSSSAMLLVASAVLAVVSLWTLTDAPSAIVLAGLGALPLLALVALGCAAFGTLPSKVDLTEILPPEFWVLSRYQGPMLWITLAAVAVGPNLRTPVPEWTFAALSVELAIVWGLLEQRYRTAVAS